MEMSGGGLLDRQSTLKMPTWAVISYVLLQVKKKLSCCQSLLENPSSD